MNWNERLVAATQCVEREWVGVARPHPSRLLDGPPESGGPRHVADTPVRDYCPRCAGSVGGGEYVEPVGCAACRHRRFPWMRIARFGRHDGDLRAWVHEIKFHAWDAMGLELGRRLGSTLADSNWKADAVVPVPASAWRRWRRGIDHSRTIATGVASALDLPVVRAMKRQARPPQRSVPPSQRRANVRGAFTVRPMAFLRDATIVLVDDVSTTRATLLEACNTLLRHAGVRAIHCAVLSVAESDRRRTQAADAGESPHGG